MLVAVCAVEQRAGRAHFNAVPALRTVQPAAKRADDRVRSAIAGFDGFFTHPLVANTRATLAENAPLRIVGDHRRKVSLRFRILSLREALFQVSPIESQFLQFTLAAAITDRAVERVIRQQELEHRTLRLFDLFALRRDHHAVGAGYGAGGLQLRHLLDAHEAHATRSLQCEIGVITKGRHSVAVLAAHVNQTRALLGLVHVAVDRDFD